MNAIVELQRTQIIERMSNADYHAHPYFSSSQLKDLLRSAAHFYSHNIAKEHEKESKATMDFGTLAHTLFLEPEQFANEFTILPADAPKRPTETQLNAKKPSEKTVAAIAWWENFDATNQARILITEEQLAGANRIVENLHKLSMYDVMQKDYGMPEASFFFTDPVYDLQLRVRPDWHIAPCKRFPDGLILDLKTTTDARPHKFSRISGELCYDLSAAMYREGFQQVYQTENKPDFIYLVAENTAPFNVKQYKASEYFIACGENRYNRAKELLAESLLIDEWDGYNLELEEINLPSYLSREIIERVLS